jgi:glycerophosphoryl diester phosphodiesterase
LAESDYLELVLKKTCWLAAIHPLRVGALLALGQAADLDRFVCFGFFLGAAFQIQDDVLNLIGDHEKYGKELGGDLWEGKRTLILIELLKSCSPEERDELMVYGGDKPVDELRRALSGMKLMSRQSLTACLWRYIAWGWTGAVSRRCADMVVLVPSNIAPWLWGWPGKFLSRMQRMHSETFVLGPYQRGQFSTGIDTAAALRGLPAGYTGGIWTDDIETVGRAFDRSRD